MAALDSLHVLNITPTTRTMPNNQGKSVNERFAEARDYLLREFPSFALSAGALVGGMFFGPEDVVFLAAVKANQALRLVQVFEKGKRFFRVYKGSTELAGLEREAFIAEVRKLKEAAGTLPGSPFSVGTHGAMPIPRLGQESHHGVMSAWMKKNFAFYDPAKAPAILMPEANHRATFGVFNKWRAEMANKMGGTFDWSNVSEADMRLLSEKMFDAASVPTSIREQYWAEFERMKIALSS
jgi:hypothetical protein